MALSSVSAILVCHPGPVAFQRANVSGNRRSEIAVLAAPDLGRPLGLSIRSAAAGPNSSGRTSAAGFAFAKVAFVHSGFSRTLRLLLVLRFKPLHLSSIGLSKTDHMDRIGARRKDQGMKSPGDHAERLESALPVILTGVFHHKGAVPIKFLRKLERDTARRDVSLVLLGIEAD